MLIGHFSDTHGYHHSIFSHWVEQNGPMPKPDIWLCTGDFFSNFSRGPLAAEIPYQTSWFELIFESFSSLLGGIPLLSVDGNHDFVKLGALMAGKGYPAQTITPNGLEFMGKVFAGFPEIPLMKGEWSGESTEYELFQQVEKSLISKPDILAVHAPPLNVLSEQPHYGNKSLAEMLETYPHLITDVFMGHVHKDGGKHLRKWDVNFWNNSCTLRFIEVE